MADFMATLWETNGESMHKALTKADIVEAVYEKSNKNRSEVKEIIEDLRALYSLQKKLLNAAWNANIAIIIQPLPQIQNGGTSGLRQGIGKPETHSLHCNDSASSSTDLVQ